MNQGRFSLLCECFPVRSGNVSLVCESSPGYSVMVSNTSESFPMGRVMVLYASENLPVRSDNLLLTSEYQPADQDNHSLPNIHYPVVKKLLSKFFDNQSGNAGSSIFGSEKPKRFIVAKLLNNIKRAEMNRSVRTERFAGNMNMNSVPTGRSIKAQGEAL